MTQWKMKMMQRRISQSLISPLPKLANPERNLGNWRRNSHNIWKTCLWFIWGNREREPRNSGYILYSNIYRLEQGKEWHNQQGDGAPLARELLLPALSRLCADVHPLPLRQHRGGEAGVAHGRRHAPWRGDVCRWPQPPPRHLRRGAQPEEMRRVLRPLPVAAPGVRLPLHRRQGQPVPGLWVCQEIHHHHHSREQQRSAAGQYVYQLHQAGGRAGLQRCHLTQQPEPVQGGSEREQTITITANTRAGKSLSFYSRYLFVRVLPHSDLDIGNR